MKKVRIVFWAFTIMIIAFLIASPVINDFSAKEVTKNILLLPLPENTEVMEKFSRAGKLTGNGNGMQYLGAVLIHSDLPLDELNEYYSIYRKRQWDYIIEEQETQNIDIIEHGSFSFQTDISGKGFYILYSWGDGKSPFKYFDLRGN